MAETKLGQLFGARGPAEGEGRGRASPEDPRRDGDGEEEERGRDLLGDRRRKTLWNFLLLLLELTTATSRRSKLRRSHRLEQRGWTLSDLEVEAKET